MEIVVERVAGLDVHKASVTACVRVPADAGERAEEVQTFRTTVPSLLALADWLEAHGVTQVAMEATGVYWKPVWAILEDRFSCILVNARHVKQVPGRKTDVTDAQWLCRLAEAGLLRASLVPPQPIRALRNLTRYRKAEIRDRQREAGRQRRPRARPDAARTPRRLAREALDSWHSPRRDQPHTARLLPRRVHIPLQPPSSAPPRAALLPTAGGRAGGRSPPLQHAYQ